MAPNLAEDDTIEKILENPKAVSWDTFKALGVDPAALIPKPGEKSYGSYRYRNSSLPSYTGVSAQWRNRKISVPAKYRGVHSYGLDRDSLDSSFRLRNTEKPCEDELIVYDTEVIYLNQQPQTESTCSEDEGKFDTTALIISPEPLPVTLDNAYQLLHSFKLEEAEAMFLKLYSQYDESGSDENQTAIKILLGLAEICLRKSRLARGNPMESQWLQAHAVGILHYTLQICHEELHSEHNNQKITWYQEQQDAVLKKLKPAEDNFVKAMYTYLQSDKTSLQRQMFFSLSAPTTPTGDFSFPLSTTPLQHVFPAIQFRNGSLEALNSDNEDFPGGLQWLLKFQDYCQDRMNNKDSAKIVEELFSLNKEIANLLEKDVEKKRDSESGISKTVITDLKGSEECDTEASQDLEENENEDEVLVSPLQMRDMELTLAKLINKLADKLVSEGDNEKSEALYQQSNAIIKSIQNGTKGMLTIYAQTTKSLGMIQIKLGQVNSGLQHLKTALKIFREVGDEASNSDIALALVEIGDSYTMEKWDEQSIFDHVIDVIREAFDKESFEEGPFSSNEYKNKEEDTICAPKTEMSDSFVCSIQEAIQCYEEATEVLENLSSCRDSTLYARAITRLGDSHFVQKEYHEALYCYEKAQTLFRTTSGRSALIQHGHVMCMLGTTSFMLHLYPKAAMVFECAYRMLKHAYWGDNPYKLGLLLSLLGLATYKLQHYHKCIPWCFRAYEIYTELFEDTLTALPVQKLWITCQTLYILGNSYNVLNLHEKAIHYLSIARSIMKLANNTDKRQYMRVLQVLGDCYFAQYDYKTALTFYNEALEDFEGESFELIKAHQNIAELNQSSDDKGFKNQLLSRSADAHLHMNEYDDAFGFLAQASNIQDVLEDDINGDLVTTLHQLGNMHSMAGEVDQAIQSYKDCVEIYQEVHGDLGPEMSIILGNLATMCYVKSCMSDDSDDELEMTIATMCYVKSCMSDDSDDELEMTIAVEQNFQDALALENNPSVLIKYSSFLYSQGNYDDAVMYLQDALKLVGENSFIAYGGLEKAMLPEVLQDEVDYQEEICLPALPMAYYLLMLSFKALKEMSQAENNLLALMKAVLQGDNPVMFSLVGYALMDMGLFKDAAEFFAMAFHMKPDYHLATDNYCTCLGIMVLHTLQRSVENVIALRKKEF